MWFKNRKPFTAEELHAKTAKLIAKPPLPDGYNKVIVPWTSKTGSSFLNQWRKVFHQQLHEIASRKTWEEQRAHTIKIILREEEWIAISHVSKEAKHIESWSHIVRDNIFFSKSERKGWQLRLRQRFWLAAISSACLLELGFKLFKFDDSKSNEINFFNQYVEEVTLLDIQFREMMFRAFFDHQDDKAKYIAGIINEKVNPILNKQFEVLALMQEQIIYGKLDGIDIKKRIETIDETKKKISGQLTNRKTKVKEETPQELVAADQKEQRASESIVHALDSYISQTSQRTTLPNVFNDRVEGILKDCITSNPEVPPMRLARIEFDHYFKSLRELEKQMVSEISTALNAWTEESEKLGIDFHSLIVSRVHAFLSDLETAGMQQFGAFTDRLTDANKKWRAANPEKSAQFPLTAAELKRQ